MSEKSEESLYGLIEIAERQQNVVQTALEGMVRERMALEEQLQNLSEGLTHLQEDINTMVSAAVDETRAGAEKAGAAAVEGAMVSVKAVLDDVSSQAQEAQNALQSATHWLRWRFLAIGLAGVAGLALFWWLANTAVLWWDTSAVGRAQVRKAQLEMEIAELEATRHSWENAGMLSKISHCGPKKRPCVRVDDKAGAFGDQGDYRIIRSD